jgi:DNA helicase II / ATP-dependent DNA helicase PcrA
MQGLRGPHADWPAEFDQLRQWYQPHLERRYADVVVRAADLDQLQRIADGCASRTASGRLPPTG